MRVFRPQLDRIVQGPKRIELFEARGIRIRSARELAGETRKMLSTIRAGLPGSLAMPPAPHRLPSVERCDSPDVATANTPRLAPAPAGTVPRKYHAPMSPLRPARSTPAPHPGGLRAVPGPRRPLGAPADVPGVRPRGLLRFLPRQARHRPLPQHGPSRGAQLRAWGALGMVLRARGGRGAGPRRGPGFPSSVMASLPCPRFRPGLAAHPPGGLQAAFPEATR